MLLGYFLLAPMNYVLAQEELKEFEFIPRGMLFEPINLDPTECIIYGGLTSLWDGGENMDGLYIPMNIGFQQSFFRWTKENNIRFEFGMEAAVFTQFTVIPYNEAYLGELMNIDYKVSGLFNIQKNRITLRARLFHVSSHLGDDYILRNNINEPNPGTNNYEQFDFTGEYRIKNLRLYGGAGTVITKHAQRDRISFQGGFVIKKSFRGNSKFRHTAGMDIKSFQQNDYRPAFRSALGIEIGSEDKSHLGLQLEYYNGHLPYSILEYKIVQWIGISAYFHPAKH